MLTLFNESWLSRMKTDQRQLRSAGRKARRDMSDFARETASETIAQRVIHSPWFQRASYIGCYLSTDIEVHTWTIIARAWRMKKRVFVPVLEKNRRMQFCELTPETELRPAALGLLEPRHGETVSARMLDIVITPVVAFDRNNHRIGMGGGYFDTTFAFTRHRSHWQRPRLIGVAFACQEAEEIQPNPWDIRVFTVITEKTPANEPGHIR